MIVVYVGTPGSGMSYAALQSIFQSLREENNNQPPMPSLSSAPLPPSSDKKHQVEKVRPEPAGDKK